MVPSPKTLREHYRAFLKPNRILLTGHSHQAWPDCARQGVLEAFTDAACHVDDKWERAETKANVVRQAVATSLGVQPEEIALAQNSHELAVRFLSALDWSKSRHVVTTDGEFHSLRRQLDRLEELGLEVTRVPTQPLATLSQRLSEALMPDTVALMVSTVLFQTAAIVPSLHVAIDTAHHYGAVVYLDAYHGFRAMPHRVAALGTDPLFVSSGGYKYAQWGEGCCWLRVPPNSGMRPAYTGWFAEFAQLDEPREGGIGYAADGAFAFAGSTYDPTSHYRAAEVVRFFEEQGLSDEVLRSISLRQTQRIMDYLDTLTCLTPRASSLRGGFVAFRIPHAKKLVQQMRARGIYTDSRSDILRLGPAPYVTDEEIDHACATLLDLIRST